MVIDKIFYILDAHLLNIKYMYNYGNARVGNTEKKESKLNSKL